MGTETAVDHDEYVFRSYRESDRDEFLALYERVWGTGRDVAWFDWRFNGPPIADGVRLTTVEHRGEMVGGAGCLPYSLRVGDETVTALQPVDWIVHPAHRRRGLCRRMIRQRIDEDRGDAALYFNFPTQSLWSLLSDMGWQKVGHVTHSYRVQRPSRLLGADHGRVARVALRATDPLARTYNRLRDRWVDAPTSVTVERRESVPATELAALAGKRRQNEIHVVHDEPFYEWRFGNPRWETTTYLARRSGEVVAGLVVCTEQRPTERVTFLAEVVPSVNPPVEPLQHLVATAVADSREADVVKASTRAIPEQVLTQFGFRPDDRGLLGQFAQPTIHAVRVLSEPDHGIRDGVDLTDPDNWSLSLCDEDIA